MSWATAGGVIDAPGIGERVGVIQLVEEVTQLAVPQEVVECPSSGQFQESGGQNEDQYSAPSRTHESSEEGEAEAPPDPVERMNVVIARFQRMNPPVFNGDESSQDADSWLHNVINIFDRAQYDDGLRLRLVTLLLRKTTERWWRGASSTLVEIGVGITWDSFCETFRQEYIPDSYVAARVAGV
ncbi:hypothetical protein F511_44454 [Dorcoceras hygrometricum]|uniref:Retrotransposon gag domain-containing protein n=1 Tax=Dorcoceras hygrometricum TaxID=472368 RepID=A0A2Z7CT07_9LAMI|nr:hypothetical protein F511_44454 [Dorcoceras hygrometricum]